MTLRSVCARESEMSLNLPYCWTNTVNPSERANEGQYLILPYCRHSVHLYSNTRSASSILPITASPVERLQSA
jgi:hypothetical protein